MSRNYVTGGDRKLYGFSEMAMFSGVVRQKLPNIQFLVEITHFPNGAKVPEGEPVFVSASLIGKMRSKSIKIAIADNVTIGISMENVAFKTGIIYYREGKRKMDIKQIQQKEEVGEVVT
jgi:translation initiation factor IF-1